MRPNDIMRIVRVFAIAAIFAPVWADAATGPNDLRDLRVGMKVPALPNTGYGGFSCGGDQSVKLPDWQAYRTCPVAPDGSRTVSFR